MPFDAALATRLKALVPARAEVAETRMFGGFGYLVSGNMCCGVHKGSVILRLGEDGYRALSGSVPGLRPMDITGKPMKAWGMVEGAACAQEDLAALVSAAVAFAESLPPKRK